VELHHGAPVLLLLGAHLQIPEKRLEMIRLELGPGAAARLQRASIASYATCLTPDRRDFRSKKKASQEIALWASSNGNPEHVNKLFTIIFDP
jgi:hypothetical protein